MSKRPYKIHKETKNNNNEVKKRRKKINGKQVTAHVQDITETCLWMKLIIKK